jgi:hypothetical protein
MLRARRRDDVRRYQRQAGCPGGARAGLTWIAQCQALLQRGESSLAPLLILHSADSEDQASDRHWSYQRVFKCRELKERTWARDATAVYREFRSVLRESPPESVYRSSRYRSDSCRLFLSSLQGASCCRGHAHTIRLVIGSCILQRAPAMLKPPSTRMLWPVT